MSFSTLAGADSLFLIKYIITSKVTYVKGAKTMSVGSQVTDAMRKLSEGRFEDGAISASVALSATSRLEYPTVNDKAVCRKFLDQNLSIISKIGWVAGAVDAVRDGDNPLLSGTVLQCYSRLRGSAAHGDGGRQRGYRRSPGG